MNDDREMETAMSILELRDLVTLMRETIDLLVEGYRSHHAALLAHDERLTVIEEAK